MRYRPIGGGGYHGGDGDIQVGDWREMTSKWRKVALRKNNYVTKQYFLMFVKKIIERECKSAVGALLTFSFCFYVLA